ncbi:MAG TPA: S8 family serine peptidase, partial [Phycisphaerales bacterium]|nr:S8 family serine peptidase [Phycisphaerales bacterium]
MMMSMFWMAPLALASVDVETITPTQFEELRAQVVPFHGKVDQPDVMGGYASTHIIVHLKPGVTLGALRDGRAAFINTNTTTRTPAASVTESQIAQTLVNFGATNITRTMPFEPANAALAEQFGLLRYYTIHVPQGTDVLAFVAAMAQFASHIESAETDGIGGVLATVPNDPSFGVQYALRNTGQTIQGQVGVPGADIKATEAWDIHTGSDQVVIAVIDTGVTSTHADLAANMVPGYNIVDGNTNTADSWLISHGTHCAGIAAARGNNATGISGVSWTSKIMPVKVLNLFGSGTETQCANGVIWAADNGANIGSMSLGYPDGIAYFENAINYAHAQGMVLAVATGNTPGAQIFFPARWANTMAVGATDNRDLLASFTTTGPEMTVTAPGVDVYSTYSALFNPAYVYQSGTSMACPHVAGLAALVWSVNPSLTNLEVRQIIEATADDLGAPGWDPQFGHGRINAHAALLAASPTTSCPADLNDSGSVDVQDLLLLL